jgi:hypothetical protein
MLIEAMPPSAPHGDHPAKGRGVAEDEGLGNQGISFRFPVGGVVGVRGLKYLAVK